MWSYTLRRVLSAIPTMLVVITVCYLLLHATPGGPFDSERKVSAAVLANLQAKYHLDLPLWQQYLLYLKSVLQGDLGASFRYADWSVNDLVASALPVSAIIGGGSLLLGLVIGVTLGIFAALRQNSMVDYLVMLLGNVGSAVPSFVLGPVLIIIFAIGLHWLPAGGWNNFGHFCHGASPLSTGTTSSSRLYLSSVSRNSTPSAFSESARFSRCISSAGDSAATAKDCLSLM